MAYMNQERKNKLAPQIKAVLKKYGVKGTISVNNHSSLIVTLQSGFDLAKDSKEFNMTRRITANNFSIDFKWQIEQWLTGQAASFLSELMDAMNGVGSDLQNHDKSDAMTDYFDVGWYTDIKVGNWAKPYVVTN
jgi:hypothetical protein